MVNLIMLFYYNNRMTSQFINILHLKHLLSGSDEISSVMESRLEILSRLKFILAINENEKINIRSMTIQPNNWITSFVRTFISPDTRSNTLRFVKEVIDRSVEIVNYCRRHEHTQSEAVLAQMVIRDLHLAQQGLKNLCITYKSDTKFCCDMIVMIENISLKLQEFGFEET